MQLSHPFSAQDYYVDSDITKAQTLPVDTFCDPRFLDFELRTLFSQNWLFVPQKTQAELRKDSRSLQEILQIRGQQYPFSLLQQPLFLQRDWDEKLHCFPNVCTHAWFPLVHGVSRERLVTCQQHGRKFDCTGKFAGQPGFQNLPGMPRPEDHLKNLPLAEWGPFFFLSLGTPWISFDTWMKPILDSLPLMDWQTWQRMPQVHEEREVDGNWKQHAWNYMDKFHVTFIHRAPGGLGDAVEMNSYQTELYPGAALQWVYARNPEHGFDPELLPPRFHHPEKRVLAIWWFLFPNLTLNFYPWGLSINVYYPVPKHPEKTLFLWYHYVRDEKKYEQRNTIWLNQQVDQEDVDAMTQVRRGISSFYAVRGNFSPQEESGPHWFHRTLYTQLFPTLFLLFIFFFSTLDAQPKKPSLHKKTGYISVEVREKPLQEIVVYFREQTGANILIDPEISAKVSIVLNQVPWREALQVIVEQTNCELIQRSDQIWQIRQPPIISIEFQDADIRKVLSTIASVADINLVFGEEIQGKVTVRLKNVPWYEAMDAIVKTTGPGYALISVGNRISRVVDIASLEEQTESFRFYPSVPESEITPSLKSFSTMTPVTLQFSEVDRRTAIYHLATLTEMNLICPETLCGTISLNIQAVSPEFALQAILKEAQPPHEIRQWGSLWRILPTEKK